MKDQDYSKDQLASVAQACKLMNMRFSARSGSNAAEGISCRICGSWDGSGCTRKAFDNILSELHVD